VSPRHGGDGQLRSVYRSAVNQVVSMNAVLATTAKKKTRSPSSNGFAHGW
jgi:hypothetical protein